MEQQTHSDEQTVTVVIALDYANLGEQGTTASTSTIKKLMAQCVPVMR